MLSWPTSGWLALVVVSASIAAWTDWRSGRIYNWLTLPGMLAGFLAQCGLFGWSGAADSFGGWLAAGGLMVVALALFPHVGGGDVKLMAMLGAMLGVEAGLETLLWTCAVAMIAALGILTWKAGIWNACRAIWMSLLPGARESGEVTAESGASGEVPAAPAPVPASDPVRELLNDRMRMAPAALVAVLIVLTQRLWGAG